MTFRSSFFYCLLWMGSLVSVLGQNAQHAAWTQLLNTYVNDKGLVNYKEWHKSGRPALDAYIEALKARPPSGSDNEQLSYWINAYNALTIQLVLAHYPLGSIRDVESKTGKNPWEIALFPYDGKQWTLNGIEHEIIRKKWKEARIHFVLVCAARSCPYLRQEAFEAEKLEKQLTEEARRFINNGALNQISECDIGISTIFNWYKSDFEDEKGNLIAYINQYSDTKINEKAAIRFLDYDWALNTQ